MNPQALQVLMIIPSLAQGGAERAFVRQANALAAARHSVTCYVPWQGDSDPAVVAELDARIKRVTLPLLSALLHRALYKLDLRFPFLRLEQRLHATVLRGLHHLRHFDVVNPHLRGGTQMACAAFEHLPVPVVESDHGDYALLLRENPTLAGQDLIFRRVDAMICPARANQERIRSLPWRTDFHSTVIPYAHAGGGTSSARAMPADGTFTFGMVSRGVPEKGWQEALAAFDQLRRQSGQALRLLFVGGGAHLDHLAHDLSEDLRPHVIFAGAQDDPRLWIECFDVALLPSYFTAESLPNVIIECLAQGKPVIATDIGGIPDMLHTDAGPCGLLVPMNADTQRADVPALAMAMRQLLTDTHLRQAFAQRAAAAVACYQPQRISSALCEFFSTSAVCTSPRQPTGAIIPSLAA